jgi:hypothetical protein
MLQCVWTKCSLPPLLSFTFPNFDLSCFASGFLVMSETPFLYLNPETPFYVVYNTAFLSSNEAALLYLKGLFNAI